MGTLIRLVRITALSVALAVPLVASVPTTAHAEPPGLRFGLSGAGGGFAGDVGGAYGGLQLRLGAQWTRGFATYVMSQGLIGSFVPSSSGADLLGVSQNSLMIEGSIGVLQLGAGPSADWMWGCNASRAQTACGAGGAFFGLDGRVGLHFGLFTISLDVHPTWLAHDSVVTWVTLGLGFDV